MSAITPKDAHAYLDRWSAVKDLETEALRKTSMETKARQLSALMLSRKLFGQDPERESGVREVRERWARIRQASRD